VTAYFVLLFLIGAVVGGIIGFTWAYNKLFKENY
jgi:hypothetical protein